MSDKNIKIFNDDNELADAAAKEVVALSDEAIESRGIFSVALSGGSTPKQLYKMLAGNRYRRQIDWSKTHFFFGDERAVSPDREASNFRMIDEVMFTNIADLPKENIHRVQAEQPPADAAALYEQEIKDFFRSETIEFPIFDLILLGMGTDGHTASLFPGSEAVNENLRFFVENYVEKLGAYRLTLTFPVINNARTILFLVSGADKAAVVGEVLSSGEREIKYPAQMVNPTDGKLMWFLDKPASSLISD